jgi:ATP phosphoribosyltransferase
VNCTTLTGVVFAPKNRGLAAQAQAALSRREPFDGEEICRVRGEDVPYLAGQAAARGQSVYALTGEDLLEEWLAAGNTLDRRLRRDRIEWNDPAALFGKPALCLIGTAPKQERRELRVGICARYARLADRYVKRLEDAGVTVQRAYFQGALETVVASGMVDAVIDIVLTGRSIAEFGLCVYDVISTSDLAVLVSP